MPRQKSTHVDDPNAVGRRLREARERVGLSQRQLAFPGCSPAYISRIEAGDRIPSLQLLRELGRRLDVSEDYLATGSSSLAGGGENPLLIDAEVALRLDDMELAQTLYAQVLETAADDQTRAEALEGLGHLAYRRGRPREAIQLLEDSVNLLGTDPCERPMLAEVLGRSYAVLGELGPAITLFERCRERFKREKDPVNEVRFACLLGYALSDNGSFSEAERVLAQALEAGQGIKDPLTRAKLYWSQAKLRIEQGQTELAARYAREALETLRMTENTHLLSLAHQLLAHAYNDLARSQEALSLLREGWPMLVNTATPIQIAHYQIEEARALAALGEKEEAAALAMKATAGLGEAQPEDVGRAYVLLAEIFDDLDETARARELYELAIELLERQAPNRYLVGAYKRLAALLEAEGRADRALEILKQALSVQERAGRAIT